jgi:hypothetical protein
MYKYSKDFESTSSYLTDDVSEVQMMNGGDLYIK